MTTSRFGCFVDLVDSTRLTEVLGNETMKPIRDELLCIGKILIIENTGKYHKNLGDGHFGTFDSVEHALYFATQIQQYYREKRWAIEEDIKIKVGLSQGMFQMDKDDAYGSGANECSRIAGITGPSEVCVNADFYNSALKIWPVKSPQYFEFKGKHELKGISAKADIYKFNWTFFAEEKPKETLAGRICKCLESASSTLTSVRPEDLITPGRIIWPVVKRDHVTAIHKGQIEIIRLLSFLGWRTHLLVVDCKETEENFNAIEDFAKKIKKHAEFRQVHNIETTYLSNYYKPNSLDLTKTIEWFRKINSTLTGEDLLAINNKDYLDSVKDEIKRDRAIKFIRPILTCAVVAFLSEKYKTDTSKTILISGIDEKIQYKHLVTQNELKLGAIQNPEFKLGEHTARQQTSWPVWFAKEDLIADAEKSNAKDWVWRMFAKLPAFPSIPQTCPASLEDIITEVWPILRHVG